ncbi:unnamed protein product [Musa acuminata var. zebrina]
MGDRRVAVGVVRGEGGGRRRGGDEVGEGMHCMDHPYRSNAGGVCAFCLHEKLSKLVSSSNSSPFFPFQPPPCSTSSSSSSSPTSFSSDAGNGGGGLGFALASDHSRTSANGGGPRTMFPFLADTHGKKKKNSGGGGYGNGARQVMAAVATTTTVSAANDNDVVLRRTKSVATRTTGGLAQGGGVGSIGVADSPRKKSFWSIIYISSTSSTSTSSSSVANNNSSSSNIMRRRSTSSSSGGGNRSIAKRQQQQQTCTPYNLVDKQAAVAGPRQGENGEKDAESPSGNQASSSLGRKVARSRSVGCGSRSFSGDFLDRISTGFGDCALRRVESHREAKPKSKIVLHLDHDNGDGQQQRPRIKERVKCGGLFGGLGMMSSAYWLSSAAAADDDFDGSSRTSATTPAASASTAVRGRNSPHGRTRSWGWALASPVRAFRPYFSSKSLYAISNTASAAPVTNASDKLVNSKASRLDVVQPQSAPEDL